MIKGKDLRKKILEVYRLSILVVVSIIILSFAANAQAKSHFDKLSKDTQEDLELIQRLANNPRLLNANYLDCYLGPRASPITAPFSKSLRSPAPVFRILWHDKLGHSICYKLEYSRPTASNYLAEFHYALLVQEDVRLEDLDKILDEDSKYSLDEDGHSTQTYSFEQNNKDKNDQNKGQAQNKQNTKVFVYQDTNLVNVTRILVQYNGPPLSPPTPADMEEATAFRRNNAFEHHRLGHHQQAQKLLQSHIQAHPDDAEAHLKLAQSYKAQSCLNESIAEYKIALSKCGDDSDLREQCLEGLRELKIPVPLPATAPLSQNSNNLPTQLPSRERININQPTQSILSPTNNGPKNLEVGF